MPRRLHIAVSVFFALLAVALCVQWASSYWWIDNITGPAVGTRRYSLGSGRGWVTMRWKDNLGPQAHPRWSWKHHPQAELDQFYERAISQGQIVNKPKPRLGFTGNGGFQFPYLLPVALAIGCSVLVALPRSLRFSIRTLFIATALIALVLGLLTWAGR